MYESRDFTRHLTCYFRSYYLLLGEQVPSYYISHSQPGEKSTSKKYPIEWLGIVCRDIHLDGFQIMEMCLKHAAQLYCKCVFEKLFQ